MLQDLPLHTFGSGVLGLDLGEFIIQLITFLIVFLALRQWAFKPILKMLEDRRKVIDSGISLGEKMMKEKEALDQKVSSELKKARAEADKIIASAHYEAKEAVHSAEEEARSRADALVKDAKEQIKLATQTERQKLEKEIIGLVSEVSEAVIGEKIDANKDAALIDKALRERRPA